jgi:uncharacterized protein
LTRILKPLKDSVYKEVTSNNLKGSNEVKNASWIKVQKLENKRSLSFYPVLDEGEEKAIILAVEQKADLLLIDDLAGKRAAQIHGINVMGTLGFLKVMQKKGRIKDLKSVLDALQKQGFWMGEELYRSILEE